jgi:hypothetical protein
MCHMVKWNARVWQMKHFVPLSHVRCLGVEFLWSLRQCIERGIKVGWKEMSPLYIDQIVRNVITAIIHSFPSQSAHKCEQDRRVLGAPSETKKGQVKFENVFTWNSCSKRVTRLNQLHKLDFGPVACGFSIWRLFFFFLRLASITHRTRMHYLSIPLREPQNSQTDALIVVQPQCLSRHNYRPTCWTTHDFCFCSWNVQICSGNIHKEIKRFCSEATTHLCLAPSLRMHGALPPLPTRTSHIYL